MSANPLDRFERQHDFLIGIDSDGCAFDTMEIKHKECFIPQIINHYGLQGVSKYAREAAEFVNLYSKSRGINRFPALVQTLEWLQKRPEVVARGVSGASWRPNRADPRAAGGLAARERSRLQMRTLCRTQRVSRRSRTRRLALSRDPIGAEPRRGDDQERGRGHFLEDREAGQSAYSRLHQDPGQLRTRREAAGDGCGRRSGAEGMSLSLSRARGSSGGTASCSQRARPFPG